MPSTRILMCPPDHFHVNYQINPWMKGNLNKVDQTLAMQQWQSLRAAIEAAGAEVLIVPAQPGVPDMVFTANAATVCRDIAVPARFFHAERRGEEAHFKAWFAANGFTVRELPEDIIYEGAGDSLFDRGSGVLWSGHGIRSDIKAHEQLANLFGVEVVPLKLVDERFYHIDTCFCPLADGYLLYYPKAFDAATNAEIERRIPEAKRIAVSDWDAARFACNTINIGQTVILNYASDDLQTRLKKAGFTTVEVPLTEFLKAGGSAKCLTLKLDEPEA